MASIRARKDNGMLFIDFRYQDKRYREQTALGDTAANRKRLQKVLDRIEAIQQYCYRYLQQDSNVRSNTFIKMLLQIPAANFHRSTVVSRTTRYLKELSKKPLEVEVSNQSYELEIIPYEELWEMALESMNNPSRKRLSAAGH